jgi:hypothetical protein
MISSVIKTGWLNIESARQFFRVLSYIEAEAVLQDSIVIEF